MVASHRFIALRVPNLRAAETKLPIFVPACQWTPELARINLTGSNSATPIRLPGRSRLETSSARPVIGLAAGLSYE